MKDPKKVKQGKLNRAHGAEFERRTRKDLEYKGWMVTKWMNNVSFDYEADKFYKVPKGTTGICIPAKRKYNPFKKAFAIGVGFPDFISYKNMEDKIYEKVYQIVFVECKINGKLDKIEKEKAKWYLKNEYCDRFVIASKTKVKNKIVIKYEDFK